MTSVPKARHFVLNLLIVLALVFPAVLLPVSASAGSISAPDAPAGCYEIWDAVINVSDTSGGSQNLVFGQGLFASDGEDDCDSKAPPFGPPGNIEARIFVNTPPYYYFTDYRLAEQPGIITWRMMFQPVPSVANPITFSWDHTALPGAGTFFLKEATSDENGINIDMRSQDSYELTKAITLLDIVYDANRCTVPALASGNWSVPGTWDTSNCTGVPVSQYDMYIPNGINVDFDGSSATTVESLTVGDTDGAGSLTISNGSPLVVSDNAFVRGGSLTLDEVVNLFVDGEFLNAGTMYQTQNVGAGSDAQFMHITNFTGDEDRYRGMDITTNALNDLGATTVRIMGNTTECNNLPNGGEYRDRCFMADPTIGGNAGITLYTTAAEDDITGDAFYQYSSGTTWNPKAACNDGEGVGGSCSADNIIFSSPGYFLIGCDQEEPTAVELSSFSASNDPGSLMIVLVGAAVVLLVGTLALKRLPDR